VNSSAILSSWRSLRLGERTGFGCGRRPRRVLRGEESLDSRLRGNDRRVSRKDAKSAKGDDPLSRAFFACLAFLARELSFFVGFPAWVKNPPYKSPPRPSAVKSLSVASVCSVAKGSQ